MASTKQLIEAGKKLIEIFSREGVSPEEAINAIGAGGGTRPRGGINPNPASPSRAAPAPTSDVIPTTDIPVEFSGRATAPTDVPGQPTASMSRQELDKRFGAESRGPGPENVSKFGLGDIKEPFDESMMGKSLLEGTVDAKGNVDIPGFEDKVSELMIRGMSPEDAEREALEIINDLREAKGRPRSFKGKHVKFREQEQAKPGRGNREQFDQPSDEFFSGEDTNLTPSATVAGDIENLPAPQTTATKLRARAAQDRASLGDPEMVTDVQRGRNTAEKEAGGPSDQVHRQATAQPDSSFANQADVDSLTNLPKFKGEEEVIAAKAVRELQNDPFYQSLSPEDQRNVLERVLLPKFFDANMADKNTAKRVFDLLNSIEKPLKASNDPQAKQALKRMQSETPNINTGRRTSLRQQAAYEAAQARQGKGNAKLERIEDRLTRTGARKGGASHITKKEELKRLERRVALIEKSNKESRTNQPQSTRALKRRIAQLKTETTRPPGRGSSRGADKVTISDRPSRASKRPLQNRIQRESDQGVLPGILPGDKRIKTIRDAEGNVIGNRGIPESAKPTSPLKKELFKRTEGQKRRQRRIEPRPKGRGKPKLKATSGFDPAQLPVRDVEAQLQEIVEKLQAAGKTDFRPEPGGQGSFVQEGGIPSVALPPTPFRDPMRDIVNLARELSKSKGVR